MDESLEILLLSGGIDSTVLLARDVRKRSVIALTVDYGQFNRGEIECARATAKAYGVPWEIVTVDFHGAISSGILSGEVEKDREFNEIDLEMKQGYFPARNTIFLSLALSLAEASGAGVIGIGVHHGAAPDSKLHFLSTFAALAHRGTKACDTGDRYSVRSFGTRRKSDVIRLGKRLGVDFSQTISCWAPIDGLHCGKCDACITRKWGFEKALVNDPTVYHG